MNETFIREMTMADYEDVIRLWKKCNISIEEEDKPEKIALLLKSAQSNAFVAEKAGRIVGVVLCGTDGRYGYIHHLAVDEDYRILGLGRKLVDKCRGFLKEEQGIDMAGLFVWNHNVKGAGFWTKVGAVKIDGLEIYSLKL